MTTSVSGFEYRVGAGQGGLRHDHVRGATFVFALADDPPLNKLRGPIQFTYRQLVPNLGLVARGEQLPNVFPSSSLRVFLSQRVRVCQETVAGFGMACPVPSAYRQSRVSVSVFGETLSAARIPPRKISVARCTSVWCAPSMQRRRSGTYLVY